VICDVSKWQGAIDWSKLAPALDFVILRSSCGVNPDIRYHEYVNGCERYGVPYHAYHYIKATDEAAARTEAKVMAEVCVETSPLFYVIDAEYSGIVASRARAICEAFEDGLRHYISPDIRVALYIGNHLYKPWALDYNRYAYLWIPRYGKNTGKPETKPDYPCDLWQYTSVGTAPGISGNVDLDMIISDKPMSFFTGKTEQKGSDDMAIDYNKYILSTGTHYISNSGQDENKGYHGGAAGDQTGKEWQLKAWYNRPWSVVLRYPDIAVGLKIADLGCAAAINDKIGYDQWQRTTYWTQLQKAGYDPSKINVACEEDCTAGVTANVKAVGHLMGIKTLQNLPTDTYSGNMRSRFVAAGFKALTASKYLNSSNYLLPGDILLYEGHHAATNITYGKDVRPSETPSQPDTAPIEQPEGLHKGDYGSAVTALQILLLKWNPKCLPKYGIDGDFGSETEKAVKAFQTELCLPVTGVYDEETRKALTEIANARQRQVVVTGNSVNVRTAPNTTNGKILGVVHKDYHLPYQGQDSDAGWHLIIYDGQNAWISGKYSKVV
jgi:GH25 family lysozyme M1 (1,4-beta-N-acetylmuramidase)/peptidoglycan hydrolase-like protein with peptidoglycan-binding domain